MSTITQSKRPIAVLAAVVMLCLVMTAAIPAINAQCSESSANTAVGSTEQETYNYVSVGDSMTCGYGMNGYFNTEKYKTEHNGFLDDIAGTYPELFEQYLKSVMSDKVVNHTSLSAAALDFSVLNYLLTGHMDDVVYDAFFVHHKDEYYVASLVERGYLDEKYLDGKNYDQDVILDALSKFVKDTLEAADLITLESHYQFSYSMVEFYDAFSQGSELKLDMSAFMSEEAYAIYTKVVEEVWDLLESVVPGVTDSTAFKFVSYFVQSLAFIIADYCYNLTDILSWLNENNPEAKIIIMDTYNSVDELSISIGSIEIPAGRVVGLCASVCNEYSDLIASFSDNIMTVSHETAAVFGDELKNADSEGSNITTDTKNAISNTFDKSYIKEDLVPYIYDGKWGMPSQGYKVYDYYDQVSNHSLTAFLHKVFNSTSIPYTDVTSIGDFDFDKMMSRAFACFSQADCVFEETEDSCTISSATAQESVTFEASDLFIMWLDFKLMYSWAILAHVSYIGHYEIEQALVEAVEAEDFLSDDCRILTIINEVKEGFSAAEELIMSFVQSIREKIVEILDDLKDTTGVTSLI